MPFPQEITEKADNIKAHLGGFLYRDIPVYDLIKIQLILTFKERKFYDHSIMWLFVRRCISLIWRFLRVFFAWRKGRLYPKYLFVIDHWRPDFIEMEFDIIRHFNNDEISIITNSKKVFNELNCGPIPIYKSDQFFLSSPKTLLSEFIMIARITKKLVLSHTDILTTIETILVCLDGFRYIDGYWSSLSCNITSVITLCDAHMHEHAITEVAKRKGIRTYTLQHGMVSEFWVPVISDKIFVWGETAKKELIKLNVPEEKIVISGRLLFDKEVRDCLSRKTEIRKAFARKYGLDENKLIVAYFATNWGPEENKGLFKTFASILDLDIAPFIKLRPNFGQKEHEEYIQWLKQFGGARDVPMVIDEDIYEIFTASDVLVTCHSGSAVEAMAFNTVGIILDIYDYMQLLRILPHYHDCVVVHSREQLRSSIMSFMNDKQKLKRQKEISMNNANKYFAINPNISTSKFIAEYIRR